jgi:hypothetical protein
VSYRVNPIVHVRHDDYEGDMEITEIFGPSSLEMYLDAAEKAGLVLVTAGINGDLIFREDDNDLPAPG